MFRHRLRKTIRKNEKLKVNIDEVTKKSMEWMVRSMDYWQTLVTGSIS